MIVNINKDNPEYRKLKLVVDCLKDDGLIIYPTDTIYGLGCDIFNKKAVERLCQLRGINPSKTNLSFVCNDLSHLSEYAAQIDNTTFKMMKRVLPGPYTFILNASKKVPKLFKNNKKTVGIRVPANKIAQAIVKELGRPILSISLKTDEEEYLVDPTIIHDQYKKRVDMVINGGMGNVDPSTVINCTGIEPVVVREGAGNVDLLN